MAGGITIFTVSLIPGGLQLVTFSRQFFSGKQSWNADN
jgi:hypothetical protein